METTEITNSEDLLDVRDIIARVEALEALSDKDLQRFDDNDRAELDKLTELLDELKGYGGDEQWKGDWYPVTLIRDSYFEDYAEQLADDIGAINTEIGWPNNCIDWERAARELQQDYSTVDFDGIDYWYR